MSVESNQNKKRTWIEFLLENSLFLIFGAIAALVWANFSPESYKHLLHLPIWENDWIGTPHGEHRVVDLHYLVNDFLMAFFFAIAGKEVWEATLPGGSLNRPREAVTPLFATLGGVIVPAGLYFVGAMLIGQTAQLGAGWAIPCATDIAFSYLVARLIFGNLHPAIPFLLLLAIADDAIGLVILAIFYPQGELQLTWMVLPVIAIIIGLLFRRMRINNFWPYVLIPGLLSWIGFAKAGLHPALGFLPIIPTMPHAHVDIGLFDWRELDRNDTLNQFEHFWKNPVEIILGLFGLLNAGVLLSAMGPATWLVLLGLFVGKPLGIWGFGMFAAKTLGFGMPGNMNGKELLVVGFAAAIGFTVALFVASVAFPSGTPMQDAAKMGALLSFAAAIMTWGVAKMLGIKKQSSPT